LVVIAPALLTARFRASGLKVTPQRQAIFAELFENERHPTAEAVFDAVSARMPGISLRTVYQTLNDLVSMGELRAVDLGAGAVRFDPNVSDHHHLVCDRCGTVLDASLDTGPLLASLDGFIPTAAEVVVHGMCATCATVAE
jgi:Fur family transcriptional regulator, peroxide stress response regulator